MKKYLSVAVAAAALIGLAACSSTDSTDTAGTATTPTSTPTSAAASTAPSGGTAAADAPFGSACSAVPTDASNPGSFDAMSKQPVATAASGNPVLKTLVTAVTAAGLGDTLNSAPALTVFAPDNDAFAKIPSSDMSKVMADKAQLTKILTYHVIAGKLSPDQLAGTHKTLEGGDVTVTGSGSSFTVNGNSMVVCGNVQTSNATVYIVDTVLMPKS